MNGFNLQYVATFIEEVPVDTRVASMSAELSEGLRLQHGHQAIISCVAETIEYV